jgi:broad specificity phosphatase PhoE
MIFVLRHGQTEWNLAGRFQGRLDSPLTALGESQANAFGRTLARLTARSGAPLTAYVSPLRRARRTADLAARHLDLDLIVEPRLAEIDVGEWEGLTELEIDRQSPGALTRVARFEALFHAPGGERFEAMHARVSSWLADLNSGSVAAFTHGITSKVLRGIYLGLSKFEMLTQHTPQDGFFVLEDGAERFVTADGFEAPALADQ